ncbi:MAG: DUF559 domain-containing protein [Clostridia bacterium]|nr:DUF559 domain-containing protein [Clostridia bacterium]
MYFNYNKSYTKIARNLRKDMTPEERHLWYDFLKKLPITVHRQKNIGNYIVDFFISSKNTVIEIDGLQHDMPINKEADRQRDKDLNALGLTVLRYTNEDINKNFNIVCDDILTRLDIRADTLKD